MRAFPWRGLSAALPSLFRTAAPGPSERRVVAVAPGQLQFAPAALRLEPFEPQQAELVLSWVRDAREAYWLAPKTRPPLAAEDIRGWHAPHHQQFQLVAAGGTAPPAFHRLETGATCGYGELNLLNRATRHYWLGHLIVDPQVRGQGVGQALTRLLAARAFQRHGAWRVSLVVFPENRAAAACYQAVGFRFVDYEDHYLPGYGRYVRLARMTLAAPHA